MLGSWGSAGPRSLISQWQQQQPIFHYSSAVANLTFRRATRALREAGFGIPKMDILDYVERRRILARSRAFAGYMADLEGFMFGKLLKGQGLKSYGGETGIRTLDTLRYTRFPSVRLQPLGHLSANQRLALIKPKA